MLADDVLCSTGQETRTTGCLAPFFLRCRYRESICNDIFHGDRFGHAFSPHCLPQECHKEKALNPSAQGA